MNLHFRTVTYEEMNHSTLFKLAVLHACRRIHKKWKRWNLYDISSNL